MGVANAQYEVAIWYKEREVSLKDHMCYLFWLLRSATNGSDNAVKMICKKVNIFNGVNFFSLKRLLLFIIAMILCLGVIIAREFCRKQPISAEALDCNTAGKVNVADVHGRSMRIEERKGGGAASGFCLLRVRRFLMTRAVNWRRRSPMKPLWRIWRMQRLTRTR
jgi:hypothetical protein